MKPQGRGSKEIQDMSDLRPKGWCDCSMDFGGNCVLNSIKTFGIQLIHNHTNIFYIVLCNFQSDYAHLNLFYSFNSLMKSVFQSTFSESFVGKESHLKQDTFYNLKE